MDQSQEAPLSGSSLTALMKQGRSPHKSHKGYRGRLLHQSLVLAPSVVGLQDFANSPSQWSAQVEERC
jgi:hypothetical protein